MVRTNEESQHKLEQFAKFNAISFQCITDMVKVHVNYPSCDLLELSFLAMASDKIGNELNANIYSLLCRVRCRNHHNNCSWLAQSLTACVSKCVRARLGIVCAINCAKS